MLIKRALLFGTFCGAGAILIVFLVVEFLPMWAGVTIPLIMLGTAIAFQWRLWFSGDPSAGAWKRLGRGLTLVAGAAPIGAVTAFLLVAMWPGYIAWSDNTHRQMLTRRGLPAAEIEAQVAQHHATTPQYLGDGAIGTVLPGTIGALVTTAIGAVVLRRRPLRP